MTTQNKYKRLALAKAKFPKILKDSAAFGYKYAKLEQVINAVESILHEFDLDIMQKIIGKNVQTYLIDLVSGESELVGDIEIDTTVQLAKMNVYQVFGSAISYYRRYELLAALGLAQEDSDANPPTDPNAPAKQHVLTEKQSELQKLYLLKKKSVTLDWQKEIELAIKNNSQDRFEKIKTFLQGL